MVRRRREKGETSARVLTFTTVVVSIVWAGTFVMEIVRPGFQAPEELGAIALLVFGASFGAEQVRTIMSPHREVEEADSEPV